MKKMFKTLPLVAAILFATSCSKDDNNEVAEPAAKTVTVKMTVGYNSQSLSKVRVTGPSESKMYTQTFEVDDVIEFSGDATGTVTLEDANISADGAFATFAVTLTSESPLSNTTTLKATLKSDGYVSFEGVGKADDITECCKKYGIWEAEGITYSVDAEGNFNSEIVLQQQKAFVKMPTSLSGDVTVNVGETTLDVTKCYAVPAESKITISNGTKTFKHTVERGDVYSVVEPNFNE